jgi:3-phosphoshikimate 1-carboxyvinyltransferase
MFLMICMSSNKSSKLSGSIIVPGDKSISHRALILGSLVTGKIKIKNLLESDDVIATAEALKTLGVKINKKNNFWEIFGNGIGNFFGSNFELDMGNSGTGSRLIMGLIAGSDVEATILGDESLSKRPMKRIILPLLKTGATFEDPNKNNLPIKIKGSKIPLPIEYISPVASAQIKSSILLSGLSSTGDTTVIEPSLSRDHTERMLNYLGAKVSTKQLPNSTWKITLKGLPTLKPNDIEVPSDPSSAAFPIVASIITPNSQIKVLNVCINELRTGLYTSLIEMGANIFNW